MHAQSWIAHQRHVDLAGRAVDLGSVKSARTVVLRQARAVANVFPERHVMHEPVRTARPDGGETSGGRRQHGTQKIIFAVPISEPTAEDDLLRDRKSTRLNSSHRTISYAVFCLK